MGTWPGQWSAICDVCGFKFLSGELQKRWDGLMVCEDDFEPRHPSDYVRTMPERIVPPWVRPEPPDVFIKFCTLTDRQALAGVGVSGCMIAGNLLGLVRQTGSSLSPQFYYLKDTLGNSITEDDGDTLIQ